MKEGQLKEMYKKVVQNQNNDFDYVDDMNFSKLSISDLLGISYVLYTKAYSEKNNYLKQKWLDLTNNIFHILGEKKLTIEENSIFEEFRLFYDIFYNNKNENEVDNLISKYPYLVLSRIRRINIFRRNNQFVDALLEISIIKKHYTDIVFFDFLEADIYIEEGNHEKALTIIDNLEESYITKIFKLFLLPFQKHKKKYLIFIFESLFFILVYFLFKVHILLGCFVVLSIIFILEKIYHYYFLKTILLYIQLLARKGIASLIIIILINNLINKVLKLWILF